MPYRRRIRFGHSNRAMSWWYLLGAALAGPLVVAVYAWRVS